MNDEFRRWKGKTLKMRPGFTLRTLIAPVLWFLGVLAAAELLFVVWVMSGD